MFHWPVKKNLKTKIGKRLFNLTTNESYSEDMIAEQSQIATASTSESMSLQGRWIN